MANDLNLNKHIKISETYRLDTIKNLADESIVMHCKHFNHFLMTGEIDDKITDILDTISTSHFNLFKFNAKVGRQMTLPLIFYYVLFGSCQNYFEEIRKPKLKSFITEIYKGYKRDVTYHNDLHGSDLVQVLGVWLNNSNISRQMQFKEIDIFSIITAAAIHDFKHPGTNNTFQINMSTDIALTFNDNSVLESYHVSEAFKVLKKHENNFMDEFLNPDEYKYVRKRMIDCVLATDMTNHAKVISNVKSKLDLNKVTNGQGVEKIIDDGSNSKKLFEDQQDVMNLLIHLADIAHNSKDTEISYRWTILLYEEFFEQGDVEKQAGKSPSFLCDRATTNISKSQIGFIKFVISPSFDLLFNLIPETKNYHDNVQSNLKFWEDTFEREEALEKSKEVEKLHEGEKEKEKEKEKIRNSTFLKNN